MTNLHLVRASQLREDVQRTVYRKLALFFFGVEDSYHSCDLSTHTHSLKIDPLPHNVMLSILAIFPIIEFIYNK